MEEQIFYKERTEKLISALSDGIYEKKVIIAQTLLAVLSGQSVFLYGPPGTAKSLIANRISQAFKNAAYFEYLMNRFSEPNEVFGPVSISQLKQDIYERKTKGYLPTADIAFLDEIWKSSPAILNTLLTIINERKFKNGDQVEAVPLKGIIAASNEIPAKDQGLEALYNRFIMRLAVLPMQERTNFENLLKGVPVKAKLNTIDNNLQFDSAEWKELIENSSKISVSEEALNCIHSIRTKIDEYNKNNAKEEPVYISDRRYKKMFDLVKTEAALCDRETVLPIDILTLKNCLWTNDKNREDLAEIVNQAVKESSYYKSEKYEKLRSEYESLKEDISSTFFYNDDVYEAITNINDEPCFSCGHNLKYKDNNYWNSEIKTKKIHINFPKKYLNTDTDFQPLDDDGKEYNFYANFNNSTTCFFSIKEPDGRGYTKSINYTFPVPPTYKKGDCKEVASLIKTTYKKEISDLLKKIQTLKTETKEYYKNKETFYTSPFHDASAINLVLSAIKENSEDLDQLKLNVEKLQDKLGKHIDA